ncbi:MAG: aromatic amino acid transport family protein [Candidatus Colwellbacteria bacterium]|nr:aromatic amino acid transport family protein [Candidatus Colwellbacteria bacterium]
MNTLRRWYKEFILPAGLVGSLTVGAGMFAIPYAFARSGFLAGVLYLIFFSLVAIKINLSYANIISRKSGDYRFASFAGDHLGRTGFWAGIFAVVFGLLLGLTIYIVLAGSFWHLITQVNGYSPNILFWALGSLSVIVSLKKLASLDFLTYIVMGFIIALLLFLGLQNSASIPLLPSQPISLLIPYGIVLFALHSRAAIAPLEDYFEEKKISWKKARRPIILGTVIPACLFLVFAMAVNTLSPTGISDDAVSGLVIPSIVMSVVGVLGILALWTSYLVLGTEIRDVLVHDVHVPRWLALTLITFIPILLYLGGANSFATLVAIGGAIFLATECVLVVLMDGKITGRLSLLDKLLIAVFVLGSSFEVFHILTG